MIFLGATPGTPTLNAAGFRKPDATNKRRVNTSGGIPGFLRGGGAAAVPRGGTLASGFLSGAAGKPDGFLSGGGAAAVPRGGPIGGGFLSGGAGKPGGFLSRPTPPSPPTPPTRPGLNQTGRFIAAKHSQP